MKSVDSALVRKIAAEFGTPCYVYFAEIMRERVRRLRSFDVVRYAQKACSNVHLLRLLREAGVQIDAVSLGEIERALRAGFRPGGGARAEIVFTADVVDRATLRRVIELGIPMNAGSVDMLTQLGEQQRGHPVWLRINPGFGHGHSRKTNTGGESSKHGIWHEDVNIALAAIDRFGLDLVGLHMHIGSGADIEHLAQVGDAMSEQVKRLGRDIRAISAGGGLSIPYRATDTTIDVESYFRVWNDARQRVEAIVGHSIELEIEPGRYLVAESGILIAEVRAVKQQGTNRFALADAGFNDLMRPALYGSHHEISVLGASDACEALRVPLLVGGPLCESGDVFTQVEGGVVLPRELPEPSVGDLLVVHDTGAYGASMASNYNSRPYAPEVLVEADGGLRLVRRRQRVEDLLALEDV
jgi:diaminopimelate decarboxylase